MSTLGSEEGAIEEAGPWRLALALPLVIGHLREEPHVLWPIEKRANGEEAEERSL
jgi:hypothetical protein